MIKPPRTNIPQVKIFSACIVSQTAKISQVKLMNDDKNKQELTYLKSKYSVHALFLTYLENLTSRNHDDKDHQK